MSASTLALILASVTLSAIAQVSFKLGLSPPADDAAAMGAAAPLMQMLMAPAVLAGFACYCFGTLIWLTVLGRVDVSQAYPFVGLGFVLTAILGHVVLGDTISVTRIAGMAAVIAGIVLIARG